LPPPVQCREGFLIPLQYPRQELLVALAHLLLLGRLRAASVMNFVLDREKFQKVSPGLLQKSRAVTKSTVAAVYDRRDFVDSTKNRRS